MANSKMSSNGLTIEDVKEIQADAARLTMRRIEEAREDSGMTETETATQNSNTPATPQGKK